MQPLLKRRLLAVIILVWLLALGITAHSFAAPVPHASALLAPASKDTPTATESPTASATATDTATASPAPIPTLPRLVISQVYGGGGSVGATYNNDFVEIFNRSDVTVNLSGLSVQYASATGAALFSANVATLSGSIAPGHYYLVKLGRATVTPTAPPLPPEDAIATQINLGSVNGKVILANDAGGLPCNSGTIATPSATPTGTATPSTTPTATSTAQVGCSASDLAKIIDLVGYGNANFFEGNSAAPALSTTTADFRGANGCTDTDNNGLDFIAGTPSARNSSTTPNFCVPTATPTDTATITPTFTDTSTATDTSTPSDTPTASETGTVTDTATITDTATETNTGTSTFTPTITLTPTITTTVTVTLTRTLTPTTVPSMAVTINEVAWAGTISSSDDEWIELYNTSGFAINLAGWKLVAVDGTPNINLSGSIPGHGFFLLERSNDCSVSDIGADIIYTGGLSNNGETLRLLAPTGQTVDTANGNGGAWPAGSDSSNRNSMERRTGLADSDTAWITNTGVVKNGLDSGTPPSGVTPDANCSNNTNKHSIFGTPKQVNWATMVTPTPSPTVTRTVTPTRTPFIYNTSVVAHDFVVLNEFLPQPATDWNQDGIADDDDAFIEVKNIGTTTVNLFGWKLDDGDPSTPAYSIPGQLLSPGQRLSFFRFETGLNLPESGGTVRLYKSSVVVDSFTYPVVTKPDISWCRLPDGTGGWIFGCVPTPDEPNQAASGVSGTPTPSQTPPPGTGGGTEPPPPVSSLCAFGEDAFIPEVYEAECFVPGLGVWNPALWDAPSLLFGELPYYPPNSKWAAYFQ